MICLPGSVSNPASQTDLFPPSAGPQHPPKHTHIGVHTVNVYAPTYTTHRRWLCLAPKFPMIPGGCNPHGERNNNRQLTESIQSNQALCVCVLGGGLYGYLCEDQSVLNQHCGWSAQLQRTI